MHQSQWSATPYFIADRWRDAINYEFIMKTHPTSEKVTENTPLNASPAGQDPQVEKPQNSSNPYEKLPTNPEGEPHYFYSPGLFNM